MLRSPAATWEPLPQVPLMIERVKGIPPAFTWPWTSVTLGGTWVRRWQGSNNSLLSDSCHSGTLPPAVLSPPLPPLAPSLPHPLFAFFFFLLSPLHSQVPQLPSHNRSCFLYTSSLVLSPHLLFGTNARHLLDIGLLTCVLLLSVHCHSGMGIYNAHVTCGLFLPSTVPSLTQHHVSPTASSFIPAFSFCLFFSLPEHPWELQRQFGSSVFLRCCPALTHCWES